MILKCVGSVNLSTKCYREFIAVAVDITQFKRALLNIMGVNVDIVHLGWS
jgi:hypothetical protein